MTTIDPAYDTYQACGCLSNDCYECRRHQIDDRAVEIHDREIWICNGMKGFDIEAHAWEMANRYRCEEINKLAFEFAN